MQPQRSIVLLSMHCNKMFLALGSLLACALLSACNRGLDVAPDAGFSALPNAVRHPADNPSSPEKVALGRMLFFDPILSGGRDVACATCHNPAHGFADALDLSIGANGTGLGGSRRFNSPNTVPFAKRNSPTLLNVAFNGMDAHGVYDPATAPMFADNRVRSLEAQSLHPIAALEEMRGSDIAAGAIEDTLAARLSAIPAYVELFQKAFGTGGVTISNLGKALAAFERTLLSTNAPFDRYLRGDDGAMNAAQKRGMTLFIQNGCNSCHNGPMLSDYALHVLGVPDNSKLATDAGADGAYAFRTPTLRNLRSTAPYMHSGVHATLEDVLVFYDRVRDGEGLNPHVGTSMLDTALRPRVSQNADLIEFLDALNDEDFDRSVPVSVPSGLPVGGNIR